MPNANGGIDSSAGLAVAYNQFSANTGQGYTGRRGAVKMVIIETDGVTHDNFGYTMQNNGAWNSYYDINTSNNNETVSSNPNSATKLVTYQVVQQLCALTSANPPGYSTPRQPARIHTLAFGQLMEPSMTNDATAGPMQKCVLEFLLQIQQMGNTSPSTDHHPKLLGLSGHADQRRRRGHAGQRRLYHGHTVVQDHCRRLSTAHQSDSAGDVAHHAERCANRFDRMKMVRCDAERSAGAIPRSAPCRGQLPRDPRYPMNSPTLIRLIGWVVYATFREALASRLFTATALVAGVAIVFCLSMRVSGEPILPVDPGEARMRLPLEEVQRIGRDKAEGVDVAFSEVRFLFGLIRIPYRHYPEDAVRLVQLLLASFLADTAGVFLALIWTAGFLPGFLDPGRASVLLAKPMPRYALLVGQYLGVVAFVALQSSAFIVGTWFALGLSTGEWTAWYLMSLPILLLHFSVFFELSAWLAVCTRNTIICLVGSLSFWLVCRLVNHGWHAAQSHPSAEASFGLSSAYWLLPKPADFNWLLFELLHAERYFGRLLDYPALRLYDGIPALASILTSLSFAAALIASSARRFARADY